MYGTEILAVRGVLPPHRYPQAEITDAFAGSSSPGAAPDERLLRRCTRNAGVEHRNLVLPLEQYAEPRPTSARPTTLFIEHAVELGAAGRSAARSRRPGLTPSDVDLIVSHHGHRAGRPVAGRPVAAGSGCATDVKRVPLFGLGCVAGAAGIARMHDYLVGHPDQSPCCSRSSSAR